MTPPTAGRIAGMAPTNAGLASSINGSLLLVVVSRSPALPAWVRVVGSRRVLGQPWKDRVGQLVGTLDVGEVAGAVEQDVVRAGNGVDERVGPFDGHRVQL